MACLVVQSVLATLPAPVDWHARLFVVDDFLSIEEVDTIIKTGDKMISKKAIQKRKDQFQMYFQEEDFLNGEIGDLLQELEARIARVTMVREHDDETPLLFTRRQPGANLGDQIPNQQIRQIHHDKNQRERRVVTVLIYLSDEGFSSGETIFPCLPNDVQTHRGRGRTADPDAPSARFYDHLREQYENGTRVISGSQSKKIQDQFVNKHIGMFREVNEQCLKLKRGEESQIFSVKPKKGRAIIFWNTLPDATPNHHIWHTVCEDLGDLGAGANSTTKTPYRYTIQKFKEVELDADAMFDGGYDFEDRDADHGYVGGELMRDGFKELGRR